ncbi:MAG: hypothetical protein ACE5IY_15265 [bacterium]
MMSKRITLIILLLLVTTPDVPAYAGAWTQKRGAFFYKLGVLRFESTSQYLLNGERESLSNKGRVIDLSVYHYLEYGLSDELTVIASVPFKKVSFDCAIEECDKSSSGLADLFLGFRYRLSNRRWIVSIESGLKLAPGYETDEDKLDSAPPLGDGQTDFDLRLLLGHPLFNYRGYLNIDAGFRTRSGDPVDELPFSLELGLNLTDDYLLIGRLHGVRSISEDAGQKNFRIVNGTIQNFIGTGAVEDFVKGQLQLIYKLSATISLAFELDQVLTGRNTSHATTVGAGLVIAK